MKNNKDVPLRVRVTPPENDRLLQAADKLGLTKSVYVRWAIENSTTQVLGTTLDGQSVVKAVKPKKPKPVELPDQPAVDRCSHCSAVISAEEAARFSTCGTCTPHDEVLEQPPVPDIATAMGFAQPTDPQPATFDDSDWG